MENQINAFLIKNYLIELEVVATAVIARTTQKELIVRGAKFFTSGEKKMENVLLVTVIQLVLITI